VLHPITVAAIVANAGADAETVCAAVLHDVVEGTPFTLSRLETEFGSRIAALVRDQADMAAVDRAVADSTGAGADILLIKLADRLHNMRILHIDD
jgi:GTP pyrophosphokinase